MKTALAALALLALAPLCASAAPNDFDTVVAAVQQRYSTRAQHIPMMGFVSLLARTASAGGVKGMRIAEFDHLSPDTGAAGLQLLLANSLGSDWQPFVTDRQAHGALSLIYVCPHGPAMRMLIADFENGELDLVRLELNGDRLKLWMRNPQDKARHHHPN